MAKKTKKPKQNDAPPTSAREVLRRAGEEMVSGLAAGLGMNPEPQETQEPPQNKQAPNVGTSFVDMARGLLQRTLERDKGIEWIDSAIRQSIDSAIRQSIVMQTSPQPPKALNRLGQGRFFDIVLDNRLTEFGAFEGSKDTVYGLPKAPFLRMERKAGYPYEVIATQFLDWYFDENLTQRRRIPYYIDLLAWVSALHVEKGFDPPWIDRGFANNLLTFHQEVKPDFFRRGRLEQTARAYYEVFLAVAYPFLADPSIRIMFKENTPSTVELAQIADDTPEKTPDSEITPGPRGRRSIELADVLEIGVFRVKREENPNA